MQGKTVNFAKMSGSGNDFIVVDNRKGVIKSPPGFAAKYCHRKSGIGADGLLLVENSNHPPAAVFRMRYFNSDGSRASFCGNGARCIALFAYLKKIASRKMKIKSDAGIIPAEVHGRKYCRRPPESCYNVKVKMPNPKGIRRDFKINVTGKNIGMSFINTGVPHAVVFVKNIKNIDVNNLGRKIRFHKKFHPSGTNVNFVKVLGRNKLQIRTYERGVEGETLACGTGAVASSVISILKRYVSSPVGVLTAGGEILKVHCAHPRVSRVYLEGRASLLFENKIKM